MSGPLDHKARIVAELQERLGEATTDDDQDFLASQLSEAGNDLEGACLIALRNARETEALLKPSSQLKRTIAPVVKGWNAGLKPSAPMSHGPCKKLAFRKSLRRTSLSRGAWENRR